MVHEFAGDGVLCDETDCTCDKGEGKEEESLEPGGAPVEF